jgi:hypothetical protein
VLSADQAATRPRAFPIRESCDADCAADRRERHLLLRCEVVMMKPAIQSVQELIEKADQLKKQDKMDLSSDEDLTIALMNLISIEEHLFFSGAKTGKTEYYELLNEVRDVRKELLKKIIKDPEGEVWCISKHLLAASMRLMEVGTKSLTAGRKEEARDLFEKSYSLYSLFWGLNMNLLSIKANVNEAALANGSSPHKLPGDTEPKKSFSARFGEMVRRVLDCCIE